MTYTIVLRNTGSSFANTIRLTDTIPTGLSYVAGSLTATSGVVDDAAAPTLRWNGNLSNILVITISYVVTVSAVGHQTIRNTAIVDPGFGAPLTRSATIIVNGWEFYLPLIFKSG